MCHKILINAHLKYLWKALSNPSPDITRHTTISNRRRRYVRQKAILSASVIKTVSALELINFQLPSMMMIYCLKISFKTHCDVIKCSKTAAAAVASLKMAEFSFF